MKTKLELMNYRVDEKDVFEYHLNQKANEGLQLKWFNNFFICYEKSDAKLTYYVDYCEAFKINAPRYISEHLKSKNAFYNTMGYDFLTSFQYFAVYTSEEKLNTIHTDAKVEENIIKKMHKHYRHANFVSNLLPMIIFLFLLFFIWGVDLFDSNLKMGAVFLLIAGTIYNFVSCMNRVEDASLETKEKQIVQRSQKLLINSLIYACCFVVLSASIYNQWLISTLALAFVVIWTIWMNHLRSRLNNTKKIMMMLLSFGVYVFMLCSSVSFISNHRPNEGKVLFSSDLTGVEKVKIIEENESFLLYHNKCRLQGDNAYFKYNYYVDKKGKLKKSIEKELLMKNFYYAFTVDDVSVYAPGGTVMESVILAKDNKMIRVDANMGFTKETIEKMILELGWD